MSEETEYVNPEVVNEWDSVIIQISNGEEGTGAIRMMKQDIEALMELHGESRGSILDMCLLAIETTPKENFGPELPKTE
jgi:hypothetical protein